MATPFCRMQQKTDFGLFSGFSLTAFPATDRRTSIPSDFFLSWFLEGLDIPDKSWKDRIASSFRVSIIGVISRRTRCILSKPFFIQKRAVAPRLPLPSKRHDEAATRCCCLPEITVWGSLLGKRSLADPRNRRAHVRAPKQQDTRQASFTRRLLLP